MSHTKSDFLEYIASAQLIAFLSGILVLQALHTHDFERSLMIWLSGSILCGLCLRLGTSSNIRQSFGVAVALSVIMLSGTLSHLVVRIVGGDLLGRPFAVTYDHPITLSTMVTWGFLWRLGILSGSMLAGTLLLVVLSSLGSNKILSTAKFIVSSDPGALARIEKTLKALASLIIAGMALWAILL